MPSVLAVLFILLVCLDISIYACPPFKKEELKRNNNIKI